MRARVVISALVVGLTLALLVPSTATSAAPGDATVSGPVTGGNGVPAGLTTLFDLAQVGYERSEFFLSGSADAYAPTAPLGNDGRWAVAPTTPAPYTTRVIVHRPSDPKQFNGTVVVEWLNVSIGIDVGVDWGFGHNELIRRGYAWVGVSAQSSGLEATKNADPARYAALSHPGDSYSYDMFTQAGRAVRAQAATVLGGLKPRRVIADGESQSAGRLVTYINAIHPLARVFDGFLVHSRGGGGAPISQLPPATVPTPSPAVIRTDNPTPVIVLQSETDVNAGARQDDSPTFRLWEMAGTAHVDAYTVGVGLGDVGDDAGAAAMFATMQNPPNAGCGLPTNAGPSHLIVEAAIFRMDRWIKRGVLPPVAPRLEVVSFSPTTYALDSNGNALGGIRTPHVDAPVARLTGLGQTGLGLLCRLVGTTTPLDAGRLASLYPSHAKFVGAWRRATRAAVDAGFILPADARGLKRAAAASTVGG